MDVFLLIIDSFGIGSLPDAWKYGDEGANTALHVSQGSPGEKWPFMKSLGLGNASALLGNILPGCEPVANSAGSWAVMAQKSPGKDTTTGHWELSGIVLEKPFTTFPPDYPSFPPSLTDAFIKETGRGYLGNRAASGTRIIAELGEEHMKTGNPIIYTSSDSVFQIAAHESIIPVDELYGICKKVRTLCDPLMVGRVIARPFAGSSSDGRGFTRTERRHDFSIALPGKSVLDYLSEEGVHTVGVGKIGDIFNNQGIAESFPEKGNRNCIEKLHALAGEISDRDRFIFVNLVDTDMHYGHRRDVMGYYNAVCEIDAALEKCAGLMGDDSVLIISADHGCDPSFTGTDHTREYAPLLIYSRDRSACNLVTPGIMESFSFAARLLPELFKVKNPYTGSDNSL